MKTLTLLLFTLIGFGLTCFADDEAKKKKAPKKPDSAAVFAKLDADSDAKMTQEEFTAGMKTMAKARAEKAGKADEFDAMWEKRSKGVEKRFAKVDANSDGHVTAEEFAAAPKPEPRAGAKKKKEKPGKKNAE